MAEENINKTGEELVENIGESDVTQSIDSPSIDDEEVAVISDEIVTDDIADTSSDDTAITTSDTEETEGEFSLPTNAVWQEEEAQTDGLDEETTDTVNVEETSNTVNIEEEFILPTNEEQILIPDFVTVPIDLTMFSENGQDNGIDQPLSPAPADFTEGLDDGKAPDEEQILIDIDSAISEGAKKDDEDEQDGLTQSNGDNKKEEAPSRFIDTVFDFVELAIFTLAFIMILTSFFFHHSIVDGDSMLGTLEDGQHLIISNFMYEPSSGDIVVVEDYTTALKKPIIKRVIATAGQKVKVAKEGIYVDGRFLEEDYVFISQAGYYYDPTPSEAIRENDTLVEVPGLYYEFVVPEGEIFVMGDHRNNSTDSRHIGTVDEDALIGRVILRFFPFDKFGTVNS